MSDSIDSVRDRVIETIAESDNMHQSTLERYFGVGQDALRAIQKCLLLAGQPEPSRVLDFGCGWGRVTRFIRAAWPDAEITACDVAPRAIEFNSEVFQTKPVLSNHSIEELELPGAYDLIWCGSVVTHITESNCRALLGHFATALVPDGLMVFTTHGRYVHRRRATGEFKYNITDEEFEDVDESWRRGEFGRVGYNGNEVYGFSLQPPAWIFSYLEDLPELRLVAYIERGWDDHQDVVAIQKRPIYAKHG